MTDGRAQDSTCRQFEDDYDLYLLGALEEPEASLLAEHLRTGCDHCQQELQRASFRTQAVAKSIPLVEPPARLRRRISASVAPVERSSWNLIPWLTAAALAIAVLILWQAQNRQSELRVAQLHAAEEAARVSSMLEILGAPGTVELPLTDVKDPALHGALYVHRKLGMALVFSKLPTPPAGWVYQSWVIPKNGTPQPVESFDTDAHGRALSVVHGPVEVGQVSAMAVSMEPIGAIPTKPTTTVFSAGVS